MLPALAAAQARPVEPVPRQRQPRSKRPGSPSRPPRFSSTRTRTPRKHGKRSKSSSRSCPPAVGRVLRTDPSLLGNDSYLAPYPALSAFLKQHPEIRNAPGFFFEQIGRWSSGALRSPSRGIRCRPGLARHHPVLRHRPAFFLVTGALVWIIRTIIEYRRWHRTSKVHTEVHNKLMDRFTANEDLLAYMQTPAAQRFLESAPLSLEAPSRPVGAPLSRILWSVQVGVVLGAGAPRLALREQPRDRRSRAAALRRRCARAGGRRRLRRVGRGVVPPLTAPGALRTTRRRRASTSPKIKERGNSPHPCAT